MRSVRYKAAVEAYRPIMGEVSIWRFDSKLKEEYKAYLLLYNKTGQVLGEHHTIEGIGTLFDVYEMGLKDSEEKE